MMMMLVAIAAGLTGQSHVLCMRDGRREGRRNVVGDTF